MVRHVRVAAVEFESRLSHFRKTSEAEKGVLDWLGKMQGRLLGYGLDLIVLSEGVESVGQTVETAESTDDPGPFLRRYQEWAREAACHIAGSLKLRSEGSVFNAVVFVGPDGTILGHYAKSNLTVAELEAGLRPGNGAAVVDTAIGRLGGVICFDLNFEWLRQEYRSLKPDILCFPSMYHGGLVQAMWAYDCRSFFVSALPFHGSGILDPAGRLLKSTDCYTNVARWTINLDRVLVHLDHNRGNFPEIEKKYPGRVSIDIPPNLGPALIYSHDEKMSAMDIVEEFGLELLDDYFARALSLNRSAR